MRKYTLLSIIAVLLIVLINVCAHAAAPSILNAGTHADDKIVPAIVAALGSNPLSVDYNPTAGPDDIVALSSNTLANFYAVGTTTPAVNHATYGVLNASYCCYEPFVDQQFYATLEAQNTVYAIPLAQKVRGTSLPTNTEPGIGIAVSSSQNSSNGGTGPGIEFGLSTSYLGLDTSEDSWVSAEVAGFLGALLNQHPTWNFFDAKAALRVTASQWATGYNNTFFGYGYINYSAATAASTLYLQPPGVAVSQTATTATFTLFPFRQTRRGHEVIYSVNPAYSWPVKNEYSLSDITASGATLLYTGNSTDIEPSFTYNAAATGTLSIIAFTTDGAGAYSRVESFSLQQVALSVGTACTP
jgi:hypothetical protein